MKQLTFLFLLFLSGILSAQDVIYTASGDYSGGKTPLDSIIIDNITNGTSISFGDLPEHDYYQINLSKNAYWGTVSVFDIEEPSVYKINHNEPGLLSIKYNGSSTTKTRVSVINLNGQTLYQKDQLFLEPLQSLQVNLETEGMYFVKIESPEETNTIKVIGSASGIGYNVEIDEAYVRKSASSSTLKSMTVVGEGDFTFEEGDSIRIWAFRKDKYAWPEHMKIEKSGDINFHFENVKYRTERLIAYPDSIGEEILIIDNYDTLFVKKINGEYVHQGDIILTEEQLGLDGTKGAYITRDGIWSKINFWPEATVYYSIGPELQERPIHSEVIKNAIFYWHSNTALNFIERSGENETQENYIEFIYNESGSASKLGMQKGRQIIKVFTDSDELFGDMLHEIGHAVGLLHEQSRSDRDDHVIVDMDNIKEEHKDNYKKYRKSKNIVPFDWNSIMLYSSTSNFAVDKEKPVMVKEANGEEFSSQNSYLSLGDIKTIDEIYGLNASKKPAVRISGNYNPEDFSYSIFGEITDEGEGTILERGVGIRIKGEANYQYLPIDTNQETFSKVFTELTEYQDYYFLTYAINQYGRSISEILNYTYKKSTKPEVETVKFDSITDSSVKLFGEILDRGKELTLEHGFYWSKDNPLPDENDSIFSLGSPIDIGEFKTTLTNLQSNTTYFFRAFATNKIGTAVGDTMSFTTLSESTIETGTLTDSRDGKTYKTVKIGEQWWMAENLAYLPSVSPPSGESYTEPYHYVYGYNGTNVTEAKETDNYKIYGVLYNWAAAKIACPSGWHLPLDNEWGQLKSYLINNGYGHGGAGEDIAKSLAAKTNWNTNSKLGTPGNDSASNNSSGFSSLPGGAYYTHSTKFEFINGAGYWWCADGPNYNTSEAYLRYIHSNDFYFGFWYNSKKSGYSVRCIKD